MPAIPHFRPPRVSEIDLMNTQYEIRSYIASGAMGAVYLGHDLVNDCPVAIKVLPPEMSVNATFIQRFEQEASLMSKFQHKNLVKCFHFCSENKHPYIVMELVYGRSLEDSMTGEPIEPSVAVDIIIKVTEGVLHAHELGIIHRDIKPANILMEQDFNPKLGDFGLSRHIEEEEFGSHILMTPGYSAPEILHYQELVDERSDVFALGMILYELITGRLPVDFYTPPSYYVDVSPLFDFVIAKATNERYNQRYHDAPSFLADLKKLQILSHSNSYVAA